MWEFLKSIWQRIFGRRVEPLPQVPQIPQIPQPAPSLNLTGVG